MNDLENIKMTMDILSGLQEWADRHDALKAELAAAQERIEELEGVRDKLISDWSDATKRRDENVKRAKANYSSMKRSYEKQVEFIEAENQRLREALEQVKKNQAYQKLSGGKHFTSTPTEMEWKAASQKKTDEMVDAALQKESE